ncbi:LysR family transcriptional regulator [Alphaproteobacteria bacterium KMM 3653]|uniref:LysR family transcriptional regulator n=1 Tax=Harenicola maris TaxID=2841044 RepID=A0AAP2CQ26_9RHOB|nr:LysR family transcriptional regulator [Harenicola maris]
MAASWDDLRVFLAVSRRGSLSGAGQQLSLDPATVGRRVQRLEEGLGAVLFQKSPQGYALSEAGERLMPRAEQVETAIMGAEDALQGQQDRLTGTIRIGAPDGCASFILPQVLARIGQTHPELDIQIVSLPRVFNLTKREADIAISVSPPSAGRLSVEKITDYQLVLAASRQYLRHNAIERLEDLKSQRIVGYIPDMIHDKELDYLSDLGIERVHLASNSVVVQFNWIKAGMGIGIAHRFALAGSPRIATVLGEEVCLTRSFYLVRPADDLKVQRLNRVAALISEGVRDEVVKLEAED